MDIIVIDDNSKPPNEEAIKKIMEFHKKSTVRIVHLDDCKFIKELMEGEYYNK